MDGSLWQACLEATSAAERSRRGEETAVSVRQCAGHLHSRSNLAPARAAAQRDRGRGNQRHPFQGVLAAPLLRCFLASAVLPAGRSIHLRWPRGSRLSVLLLPPQTQTHLACPASIKIPLVCPRFPFPDLTLLGQPPASITQNDPNY
jgi:hypothetical protein